MKVLSVNVGLPRNILINERSVSTGIFKEPVSGRVRVTTLNLEGDKQADLKVHGGPDKAVYAYPSEHYPFWRRELHEDLSVWGAFGENLTVEGLAETHINIGDRLAIGTALFQVTQPRLPCFKLAAKFNRQDIIETFLDSRRTGFYLRVLNEGFIEPGDSITIIERDPHGVTVDWITGLYTDITPDRSLIERALSVEALATSWRSHFERKRQ